MVVEYDRGETARIEIETRNDSEELEDVASVTIEIFDPGGTVVASGSMTHKGTGKYSYGYPVPLTASRGDRYRAKAKITNSAGEITYKQSFFDVR